MPVPAPSIDVITGTCLLSNTRYLTPAPRTRYNLHMLVRDVGEFRLIELLTDTLENQGVVATDNLSTDVDRLRLTIGDDAAAWDAPAGTRVFTTDTMVEGVHFVLDQIGWCDVGWKAMAVNLSDVAAMGCLPTYSIATLGLRDDLPVDGLVEMYRGIADACREHGGMVVGGDVVRSPVFFLTVAMEGAVPVQDKPEGVVLTRSAAQIGDVIAVTSTLGDSAGGLRMALAGELFDDSTTRLRKAHFRPVPRLSAGQALVKEGVKAAMDISDGLIGDLTKLCEASGVGAVVRAPNIPISKELTQKFPDEWLSLALTGGEDYELLFTGPEKIVAQVAQVTDIPITIIGEIDDLSRGVLVIDGAGGLIDIEHGGWDHFRNT